MTLYQGDNTAAFGGNFLTINLTVVGSEQVPPISKAELKIGGICKTFVNPTFPLTVNLTEEESSNLQSKNKVFLAVWDRNGRKKTCVGSVVFDAQSRRV